MSFLWDVSVIGNRTVCSLVMGMLALEGTIVLSHCKKELLRELKNSMTPDAFFRFIFGDFCLGRIV